MPQHFPLTNYHHTTTTQVKLTQAELLRVVLDILVRILQALTLVRVDRTLTDSLTHQGRLPETRTPIQFRYQAHFLAVL